MNAPETILHIDDDYYLRDFLREVMERFGYRVIDTSDGHEGLQICAKDPPDLILLDVKMPEMDGFEVCKLFKADPQLKEIPIIFLTGEMDAVEKLKAFHAGGVDYITKPFEPDEFRVRLQTHLKIRRQRCELLASEELLKKALFDAGMMNSKLIAINEKLRQSEDIKSQFIANMRNEINNPLSAILGLAEEITHPSLPMERARQLARMIEAEAFHLDFQIRNIFCAADLEAGEAYPVITKVDVGSILHDVMASLAYFAQSRSVEITLSGIPEGETLVFATDAEKLRIIAANLLDNAIEYSHPGAAVEVRAGIQKDSLILAVKDDGIGIRQADKNKIFERFRQLDTGASRQHQGQGLGLPIVKALAEFLDGWIKVESEPGKGSLFTCSLPKGAIGENSDDSSFGGNLVFFGDPEEE